MRRLINKIINCHVSLFIRYLSTPLSQTRFSAVDENTFQNKFCVRPTMPIDKFWRHHYNRDHDESHTFVLKEFPKMYYESRLLLVVMRNTYTYKVTSPTGVIKQVTFSDSVHEPLRVFINNMRVKSNELIGRTLKEGDVIRLVQETQYSVPSISSVEFILKVPIITENL